MRHAAQFPQPARLPHVISWPKRARADASPHDPNDNTTAQLPSGARLAEG